MSGLALALVPPARAEWRTLDAAWRSDTNPFARKQVWESFIWKEGWKDDEQFYPAHFKPAGSLHVVLRNAADHPDKLQLIRVDGKPVSDITTTPERIGPVIYQWVEPEAIGANDWTECVVRLRAVPAGDVRLTFQPGTGSPFDVVVPARPRRVRIEGAAFSPTIDRLFLYIRALDGSTPPQATVILDGREFATGVSRTDGPEQSGLALLEAPLSPAWPTGSHHLVQVKLAGGEQMAQPVRAWDSFFSIGLFGTLTREKAAAAKAQGFNTYVAGGSMQVLDELGLNYVVTGPVGAGRARKPGRPGRFAYYNMDEPDGHDALQVKTLPLLDRLGVNAMKQVIPIIRSQRSADPATPNLVLLDNTYKPANWYVYGQLGDICATDPYVPISAEQLERVPCSLAVSRDACSPHPLIATIWATANSGHRWCKRPPTPQEERMMAYYAMGSGISGLWYFADIGIEAEGGKFIALSENPELWKEVGGINRDAALLAPYLSIACPVPGVSRHEDVWIRSLLSGPARLVTVVVNKGHEIGFNTVNHAAFHIPARDVEIAFAVPKHLEGAPVREVVDGRLVPLEAGYHDGQAHLKLGTVDTARAFVLER
jgi:hypothetical protein